MKNRTTILLSAVLSLGTTAAMAQNLDATSITDQFTTGARGQETAGTGTAGFGAAKEDGSEFLDYSGADSTGGPIRYINVFSGFSPGDSAAGESPVIDVTSATAGQGVGNPDRSLMPGGAQVIAANTRSGATSPTKAVLLSDDGGENGLIFGEDNDANYYVEVDAFFYDLTAVAGDAWLFVGIRGCVTGARTGGGLYIERDPSYALVVDENLAEVKLVEFSTGLGGYTGVEGTVLATSGAITKNAWHTLRISANGSTIRGSVDGTEFANVTDATVTAGRGFIGFRDGAGANGTGNADERAGTFDNLKAGPQAADVADWNLF